jgi:CheY-like chemotaxis protein
MLSNEMNTYNSDSVPFSQMEESKQKAWIVLVVDDNANDVSLLQFAAAQSRSRTLFHTAHNGNAAIEYLAGAGIYADRQTFPLPHLILLDLKLPGMDSSSVLKWIREKSEFKNVRVVAWSASSPPGTEERLRVAGADRFLDKPDNIHGFKKLVSTIAEILQSSGGKVS